MEEKLDSHIQCEQKMGLMWDEETCISDLTLSHGQVLVKKFI